MPQQSSSLATVNAEASTPAVATNLPLEQLIARIKVEHESAQLFGGKALQHARKAGELLIEAKGQVAHGQWEHWLADNCPMATRTANGYMRIARCWPQIEQGRPAELEELTINQAARLLRTRTRKPEGTSEHTPTSSESAAAPAQTVEPSELEMAPPTQKAAEGRTDETATDDESDAADFIRHARQVEHAINLLGNYLFYGTRPIEVLERSMVENQMGHLVSAIQSLVGRIQGQSTSNADTSIGYAVTPMKMPASMPQIDVDALRNLQVTLKVATHCCFDAAQHYTERPDRLVWAFRYATQGRQTHLP